MLALTDTSRDDVAWSGLAVTYCDVLNHQIGTTIFIVLWYIHYVFPCPPLTGAVADPTTWQNLPFHTHPRQVAGGWLLLR